MEENNNWNNMSRVVASRAKRGDSSRTGSHRNRPPRVNPGNVTRNPTYIDDVTLNAMITSGMMEALAPVHFAQFRVPIRQPIEPNQNEAAAAQIDYRLGWIPKNLNLSSIEKGKEGSSKFKSPEKDRLAEILKDEEPPKKDPRFLLPRLIMEESEQIDETIKKKRQETIMQWFDRAVEKELSKVKTPSTAQTVPAFPECMKTLSGLNLNYPQSIIDKMAEASASQIEIIADMAMEPDTELTDAVEKLAKAEAMCAFAGAVKAAEEAAEAAPPGFAEEAALASARIFQSEITATEIREHVQGNTPMEVIGYIGITKPKNPVKSG
ncbi:unnamed protein product [Psylliodes chrysocephalus]|uniref:Uncharacterized protein n=1 Tax=Psylliodes chrysocephalus TaxID=3402493 RepID=A0A9P0GAG6_9CUCU|nr:unnamed protein product [Psylliodes chrysocephala]